MASSHKRAKPYLETNNLAARSCFVKFRTADQQKVISILSNLLRSLILQTSIQSHSNTYIATMVGGNPENSAVQRPLLNYLPIPTNYMKVFKSSTEDWGSTLSSHTLLPCQVPGLQSRILYRPVPSRCKVAVPSCMASTKSFEKSTLEHLLKLTNSITDQNTRVTTAYFPSASS